ncbi:MAG: AI-2E family transporter [Armatimonadota bacterium]
MEQRSLTGRDLRMAIIFAAAVYLAIKFIAHVANVLLVLGVSALIATALTPITDTLHRYRIPRQLSTALLIIIMLLGLAGISYLVLPPAVRQVTELAKHGPEYLQTAREWMERIGIQKYLPENLDVKNLTGLAKPVLTGASRATVSAAGALGSIFLVFVITVHILINPNPVTRGILASIDPGNRKKVHDVGQQIAEKIRAWVGGVLIGMLFVFLVTWAILSVIGLEQAFLFAVIAGLFEAVPVIGPIISAVPPIVVSLFSGEPIRALWIFIGFLVIQQFEGNVLIPLVMSKKLSLHPVTVILAVLVMGGLFGIVGVFLAAPTAAAMGILFNEFYLKPRELTEGSSSL